MKILISFISIIVLFSCKKEVNAVYKKPQKGEIYIHEIASLDGNISYNVNPDANPDLVIMSGIENNKVIESELFKQKYFNGNELNVSKFESNTKPNEAYFLDENKTIKFIPILENKQPVELKVQRENQISKYIPEGSEPITGLSILDLNKDGIKEIVLLQHDYAVNNDYYYFKIFSAIQ